MINAGNIEKKRVWLFQVETSRSANLGGLTIGSDIQWRIQGGGGGNLDLVDLVAMAAIFLSVISSFFTQNKGGGGLP